MKSTRCFYGLHYHGTNGYGVSFYYHHGGCHLVDGIFRNGESVVI